MLPLLLLHAHGLAEAAIGVVDVCFLIHCALTRDFTWLRTRWLWFAAAWWIWLVLCSLRWFFLLLGWAMAEARMQRPD